MKKCFSLVLLVMAINKTFGQTTIDLNDVAKHVGDSVKVEGKIFSVKAFSDNPSAPVLLNLGAAFPNQLLTVAVFPTYKTETIAMPSEQDKGNMARVTGKVELYKGKPQIVVRSPKQLHIASADAVIPAVQ